MLERRNERIDMVPMIPGRAILCSGYFYQERGVYSRQEHAPALGWFHMEAPSDPQPKVSPDELAQQGADMMLDGDRDIDELYEIYEYTESLSQKIKAKQQEYKQKLPLYGATAAEMKALQAEIEGLQTDYQEQVGQFNQIEARFKARNTEIKQNFATLKATVDALERTTTPPPVQEVKPTVPVKPTTASAPGRTSAQQIQEMAERDQLHQKMSKLISGSDFMQDLLDASQKTGTTKLSELVRNPGKPKKS